MKKSKPTYQDLENENNHLKKQLSDLKEKNNRLIQDKNKVIDTLKTFLKISDIIPAFIAVVDAKTLKYKFVNSQFTKSFNKKRDEIIGTHISDIIGLENFEFAMRYIEQVLKGKSTSYINTFELTEGKRFANVNYVPKFNQQGEVSDIIVLTHDITALKESEIKLQQAQKLAIEKEHYLKLLFDNSPIGLALANEDGVLLDINDAYADIIGYSIDETLKLTYWDITPKKYNTKEQEQLESLKSKGSYGPYEKEYIHKSGKLIPVRLQGKLIEINDKKFIWSTVENISEKRKAEKLLKTQNKNLKKAKKQAEESEKRYRALHDASFGGIGIHDKGLIFECNKGLSKITGFDYEELIGMNGLLLIAEECRDIVMQKILSDYEKPYEVIGIRKNGKKYPLRIEGRVIPFMGKKVRMVEFRDITQQKQDEQKLIEQNKKYELLNIELTKTNEKLIIAKEKAEEREEQFRLISNNFVNGMIYQVIAFDELNRKFTYLSETVQKLYGCSPYEALDNANLIYGKVHPDDIGYLLENEKEALKNMSVFKAEARVFNPDGSIRWSYLVSQPRIINNLIYWDGIEIDITERKQMEQDLIVAKLKAEESDKLKSAFLANMSHEIRTPMNSILGFSQLLKNEDLKDEERNNYIDFINSGGNRLLTLISDIVDVSKIDANQLSINIHQCNLNKLIDGLYSQFLITILSPDVTLKTHKAFNNNESEIYTDSTRLNQILSNLLENALKFTSKGVIEFGYTLNHQMLQFYVKDSGIGINSEHHSYIFDRFKQVNDDYVKSGSGTGLGLSIVKGLVVLLKGEIWIESEINKGTTFYFTIPYISNKK